MNFRQLHQGPQLPKIANVWDAGSAVLVQGLGVTAVADIQALVGGQPLPLNVMARPTLPRLDELQRLGVRRLSAGSAIAEAAWGRALRAAAGFLAEGAGEALFEGAAPYPQVNGAMNAANRPQG